VFCPSDPFIPYAVERSGTEIRNPVSGAWRRGARLRASVCWLLDPGQAAALRFASFRDERGSWGFAPSDPLIPYAVERSGTEIRNPVSGAWRRGARLRASVWWLPDPGLAAPLPCASFRDERGVGVDVFGLLRFSHRIE